MGEFDLNSSTMFFRFTTADAPPQSPQLTPSAHKDGLTFAGLTKTFLKIKKSNSTEARDERQSLPPLATIPAAAQTAQALHTPPSSPQYSRTSSEATGAASPTSPSSPLTFSAYPVSFSTSGSPKQKRHRSESSSGQIPLSHPGLAEHACQRRESIERIDTFHCAGGVNVPVLLRTTRSELMEIASILGANALIEEQYVSGPSHF